MVFVKKYYPIFVIIAIIVAYYWKVFLKGYVPFPGDLLVGAYFPWLHEKWGTTAGVPIRNPLISDVFSQFFIWKSLIADSYRNLGFPLWNPYSYFGYPLLANFHSGALNPANILFILFGDIRGWSLYVIFQRILAGFSMFLFLKEIRKKQGPALIGALAYSMSPLMTTWSQFGTLGYSMAWLPLMFFSIHKANFSNKVNYLLLIPVLVFLLVTAGQFQALFFGLFLSCLYFLYTFNRKHSVKRIAHFCVVVLLGIAISAVQLFPTIDYLGNSIRNFDNYAQNVEYGLMPFSQLLTFFIPDFFGNPATGNYFGFFNYHETVIFSGVLASFTLIYSLLSYKNLKSDKFFFIVFLLTIFLLFKNPVSAAIYEYKIPFISTAVAGRFAIISTFCISVLASRFVEKYKFTLISLLAYLTIFISSLILLYIGKNTAHAGDEYFNMVKISLRNIIFPLLIAFMLFSVTFFKKTRLFVPFVILILIADLFRFGWKYEPQVSASYLFPSMPAIEFLKSQEGEFRIEREKGPILPPNTWSYYKIHSPSGYDPMAPKEATQYYFSTYNHSDNVFSRYAEADYFDAVLMGKDNVKYLLLLNRNEKGEFGRGGEYFNPNFVIKDWKKVYSGDDIAVFENRYFTPRVEIFDGRASVISYSPGNVKVGYSADADTELVLKDNFLPGWQAFVNGEKIEISVYNDIFQKISVKKGDGFVSFTYKPKSFTYGLVISVVSICVYIAIIIKSKKKGRSKSALQI